MLNNLRRNKSVVFTRFFLSYLAILLLPFLVFSFLVMSMMKDMKENSVRESQYVLNSVRSQIDHKMETIYSSVLSLNYSVSLNKLLHSPKNHMDISNLLTTSGNIGYLENGEDVIYIYIPEEEVLLSSKGVYSLLKEMYGKIFSYGDMDYREFHDRVLNAGGLNEFLPNTRVRANGREYSAILYIQRIPFDLGMEKKAVVLSFIDTAEMDKHLSKYTSEMERWTCLFTKDKRIIYSTGEYPEDVGKFVDKYEEGSTGGDGEKEGGSSYDVDGSIYTVVQSDFNGWLLVSGIARENLYARLHQVQMILAILFFIYAIVGCYMAYYISSRNMRPLKRMLAKWNGGSGSKDGRVDEYQMLEAYVEDIASRNEELALSNSGYAKRMKEVWAQNLILGKYNTPEELAEVELPEIAGLKRFQVQIIDFASESLLMDDRSVDDLNVRRYAIRRSLKELEPQRFVVAEIGFYRLGVLIGTNEPAAEAEKSFTEFGVRLLEHLKKRAGGNIRIGFGGVVNGMLQTGYSFVQAECAARACLEYHMEYMAYSHIPRRNERYYFPNRLREILFQAVEDGNLKQAKSILKVLNVENFEIRSLSKGEEAQFLAELLSAMLHLENKGLLCGQDMEPTEEVQGQDRFFYYTQKILAVCSKKTEQVFDQKRKLKEELMAFIDENYMNSSLCLGMAAEHFKLSESYLSYLFKKNYNVNFSTYLENLRIEQAKLFLLEGRYSVEEVGRRVGYNSAHVFRRAFRKVTGKNPSDIGKQQ